MTGQKQGPRVQRAVLLLRAAEIVAREGHF